MIEQSAFPNLRHLMDTYFNQDFDLYGANDVEILWSYFADTSPAQVHAALDEIATFLGSPLDGLNDRYRAETGRDNVSIGTSDAEARDWLLTAAQVLAQR